MDKAEQILEKHINENDLNFIFHEKKDLWQELLNAVNEALGIPNNVGQSELLFTFIKAVKEEFADENWDYLDFIANRVIGKQ